MTIKLNEFDKKLLSNIKPSDKWNKLKHLYSVNSVVKHLKIGNNKIGPKCAKHLQKLSKKDSITLNEIKDGCKDLIQKKQKHGLAKSKEKREVLKSHTKLDIGQDKAPPTKIKNPPKPRHISATQQLVNLLTAQQNIQRQQTVQRQVQSVDKILTDNIKTPELPQQPQLQLRTQTLGNQVQNNSEKLRLQLLEGSLLDRERGVMRQQVILKDKIDNATLIQSVTADKERKLQVGNQVSNYVNKQRQRYLQLVRDGNMTPKQAQQNIQNLNNTYINHLASREAQELQSKNILEDIEELERVKKFRGQKHKAVFESFRSQLSDKEQNEKQNELLSDITTLGKKQKQKQVENTLGNLQSGVMGRVSGIGEQQNIFDRNTRLDLTESQSLGDVRQNPLAFKRDISAKELDTNEEIKRAIRDRDKYLQQLKEKGNVLKEMSKQERTKGVVERDSPAPEKKPVQKPRGPRLKKEEEEVAMEEDPVDKSKLPFTKLRQIETLPAQKGDTGFYNKNYKGVLQELEKSKLKELEGNENLGGPIRFLGGSVLNTKAYDNEEKPYRQTLKKNILNHIYNHQEEKYMDLYLTTEDPISKQYYKNMGIAVGKHFLKERNEYDESLYQKGIARLKGEEPPKKERLKRGNLADFQEQYKKLGLDQEGFNKRFNASEEDSEEWDDEAEDIKKRKKE